MSAGNEGERAEEFTALEEPNFNKSYLTRREMKSTHNADYGHNRICLLYPYMQARGFWIRTLLCPWVEVWTATLFPNQGPRGSFSDK